MVAIRDAVVTAPQLSAAMLRRNMQMHGSPTKTIPAEHLRRFQHQVYRARKKLCAQQLKGFNLDDSNGKLQEFADCHLWSTHWRAGTTILTMVTTLASTTFA